MQEPRQEVTVEGGDFVSTTFSLASADYSVGEEELRVTGQRPRI